MHGHELMGTTSIRQNLLRRRHALLARYHDELERADEELASHQAEDNERGTEQWDAQVLARLGDTDARALAQIVAALRRIDDGTYGSCEDCGERIAPSRLAALPEAPSCIECASTAEHVAAAPPPFAVRRAAES